jgi:predicted nucleic acid-binding protein
MDNIALDTNILVYLYDSSNVKKRTISEELLLLHPFISSQVVSEYLNVSKRLLKLPKQLVLEKCLSVFCHCIINPVVFETLVLAKELIGKYDFQVFDAIIVSAALQADCTILYSEDLHANQLIEGRLNIKNPFTM